MQYNKINNNLTFKKIVPIAYFVFLISILGVGANSFFSDKSIKLDYWFKLGLIACCLPSIFQYKINRET